MSAYKIIYSEKETNKSICLEEKGTTTLKVYNAQFI